MKKKLKTCTCLLLLFFLYCFFFLYLLEPKLLLHQMGEVKIRYSDKKVIPFGGMKLLKDFMDQTTVMEDLKEVALPQSGSNASFDFSVIIQVSIVSKDNTLYTLTYTNASFAVIILTWFLPLFGLMGVSNND